MNRLSALILLLFWSCNPAKKLPWPRAESTITGEGFYRQAASMQQPSRDSFAVAALLDGSIPAFLKKFRAVHVSLQDTVTGRRIRATYYVAPDYLSVGTSGNWARLCISPMAAQQVADQLDCFLPTRKMVDDIYRASTVKLEPVPMYAFRDSTPSMWQHHLIIEGQRKGRRGLIAGIKKDVVLSGKILQDPRQNRVAIYGWHRMDGRPIQPLYTGHVNRYVDYSQAIRLVYRKVRVNGRWMDYTAVMKDPRLRKLLCDEDNCDFLRYDYP